MSGLYVELLWYGEQPNVIAMQAAEFMLHMYLKQVQSFKYIINKHWIYHNKKRSIFVSMPKNLAWTQQQVDST
jgi:hypothetical protein